MNAQALEVQSRAWGYLKLKNMCLHYIDMKRNFVCAFKLISHIISSYGTMIKNWYVYKAGIGSLWAIGHFCGPHQVESFT